MMERRSGVSGVGAASFLVIFTVLLMSVLTVMSMVTVRNQETVRTRNVEMLAGYYHADTEAEEILAKLRAGEVPQQVESVGENVYAYVCRVDENNNLQVKVRVRGSEYEVLEWRMVSTLEWESEDSITVWDGVW